MGIQGLQNLIKPALEFTSLHQFKGQKAAIDAMSFLYKGCYGYSYQLNKGEQTREYMLFLLRIVRVVKLNGIEPIVVFDGRNLKAKDFTIKKREETKEKNLQKANELMEQGNKNEAIKYYQRCLRVNKEMIYDTIDMLRANNIEYLISPYEADSQVAYLVKSQQADFAITEDSDLICYSCPKIVFKLSLDSSCQYLDLLKYCNSLQERSNLQSEALRCFLSQNELNRIYICIMAGSDYFPSIQGIGIKKAIDLFYRCGTFKNVMQKLRLEPKIRPLIPENYDMFVEKVALIFRYQRVFDMNTKQLITLNPVPEDFSQEDERLIGEQIPHFDEVSQGLRHIYSLEKRELVEIDMKTYFTSKSEKKKFIIQAQNNSTNNDFSNLQQTNENEKLHYNQYQVNSDQIKKLLKPQEVQQLQELKKKQEEELYELIDTYNEELGDFNFDNANNQDENPNGEDENFAKFGQSYLYSDDFQIQKKNNSDYTSYLENLCNSFLQDYQQFLKNEDSQVRVQTQIVRRASSNLNEQQENQDINNQENQNKKTILHNPFAKKSNKLNSYQPDSLDDLNLQRKLSPSKTPSKKVISDNKFMYKDEANMQNSNEKYSNQKSNSQKKVTMKDFFSKKK
ncbi:XPG I-region protein (macronuclear) [Tetrahymena thermophila SB210]|uniref:Exonuclease 1 n=1 Tax=Tetrahymena thermophila (strain SB210) TaxID=312017 RepID=I7LSZ2_TETTS|nr:XPG I-region protein [Tetrahymena thermophila SB210]EAR83942.2 XPG I-region protein [Tetrahymena thermophila SB210]|eukprot:XP_001031605.2 XPG I-region protein [Tetrahymena thermophila SB210]